MTLSVEEILYKMKLLYGNKFEWKWKDVDFSTMIDFWESELKGLSDIEIKRGYDALSRLEDPPSVPQFVNLCRPPIDPVKAYHEAVQGMRERIDGKHGKWTHPAIFWAAAGMSYDLLNKSFQSVESLWKSKLSDELAKTSWQEIPDVPKALPSPPVDKDANAQYAKVLKRYGALNVLKKEARGNGDWIVNNLERMKKGWKPVHAVRNCIFAGARALGIEIPEGMA